MEIINPDISLIADSAMKYNWIDIVTIIVQILIAIGALGALYYARRTFQQTREFNEEERESRRAYMAPSSEPGSVILGEFYDAPGRIIINLINFGINPTDKIEAYIYTYKKEDIGGSNKEIEPLITMQCFSFNPIPHDDIWTINFRSHILKSEGISSDDLRKSKYLVLRINYRDKILNKDFPDTFYWRIDANLLTEVGPFSHKRLKALNKKNEEEFWKTVRLKKNESGANLAKSNEENFTILRR